MPLSRTCRLFLFFFLFDLGLHVVVALPAAASAVEPDLVGDPDSNALLAGEVAAGLMQLAHPALGYVPAIQLSARAHFRVTGLVAHVRLEQTFRNDTGEWVEGEYLFPLPEDAAVNRLELRVGERLIVGKIHEKQEARELFEKAKITGHKASLVEQRRANLFANKLANIAPGETVRVSLDYVQRVSYRDGEFSLRFPMTVTPRYTPEGHPGAAEVWHLLNPVPATRANPIQPISLTAEINMGLPLATVESAYHALSLTRQQGVYQVALADGAVPMNRDFLLRWRAQPGSEPRAAVFHERIGAAEYALLMVLPPSGPALPSAMERELVFVIDTSGSMGGTSIDQARASLDFALTRLAPGDKFNIIEFNNDARRLFPASVTASRHSIARAREFVRHLDAGGGTEMRAALDLALPRPAEEHADRLRQVVFITDGAVGNEADLFRQIRDRLGNSRLFTVGIGSAPNSWFMRKAARFGGGDFTFIGDVLEVQAEMESLFTRLGQTVMADVKIDWPVAAETYPRKIPNLYPGEPLLVAARADDSLQGSSVVIRGRNDGEDWREELLFAPPSPGLEDGYRGIGAIWARARIESLLDEKILGRSESEVRAEVLPLALEHQLVSPYTSFLAVEQVPSRPAELGLEKHPVPNLRPQGQSAQAYAYPRTATAARLQLLLGVVLLLCTLVFWRLPAWSWR